MSEWVAEWSGSYPSLCCGEWTLYHNEEEVDVSIPFQGYPADTYGEYWEWFFGGESGWEEMEEPYEDGFDEADWIQENIEYLKEVTSDETQYPAIYEAFREQDFRYGSCGGCI